MYIYIVLYTIISLKNDNLKRHCIKYLHSTVLCLEIKFELFIKYFYIKRDNCKLIIKLENFNTQQCLSKSKK